MIVCLCHRVSESQIAGHALAGCDSFEDLQDELRVATACGACLDCARTTFDSVKGLGAGTCGGARLSAHGGQRHVAA